MSFVDVGDKAPPLILLPALLAAATALKSSPLLLEAVLCLLVFVLGTAVLEVLLPEEPEAELEELDAEQLEAELPALEAEPEAELEELDPEGKLSPVPFIPPKPFSLSTLFKNGLGRFSSSSKS